MVENASSLFGSARGRRAPAAHAAALGAASSNPMGDLNALTLVNQRIARSLRALFEPMLRQPVKIAPDPITVERWDDYLGKRGGGLASVTLIVMPPLSGQAMLVLDGGFIFRLVDLYFGGPGLVPNPLPAEFTGSAETMIGRVAKGFVERLAGGWAELAEIDFQPTRTETNIEMVTTVDGDDRVVVARFVLSFGEGKQVPFDLLYPAASLKPIAPILSAKAPARRQVADPAWMNELTRAVMNVKLPVRSVLAEQNVPLSQLMTLQPGDIIPISFGPEIPLLVANQRFARGAVGASNGRAAIRLNRIEPIEDEDTQ
jgi:flagellar motor switch protein FliM